MKNYYLNNIEFKNGDYFLVHNYPFKQKFNSLAWLIQLFTRCYYHHSSLYFDGYIYEAVSSGFKRTHNIEEFIDGIGKIRVKSKRFLRRSFSNNGLSEFKVKLINKCEKHDIKVYKVKENYTSKTCSCCNLVDDSLKLSDRVFNCRNCNISIDRDVNGSINIKAVWQGQFKPYRLDSQMKVEYLKL